MAAMSILRDILGEIRGVRCEHGRRVKRCAACRRIFNPPENAKIPPTLPGRGDLDSPWEC